MENVISKNNTDAWERLFEKYDIVNEINNKGYFEITAEMIKMTGREPRLMAKFDSSDDLPDIFKDNNLAILPIGRGSYIIGRFQNYQEVKIDNDINVETKYLPEYVTTIDYNNITSEAVSLNAAYTSGMIEDVIGEKVIPTISGRMGTGEFEYSIQLSNNDLFDVNVEKSQMEIDGSYEGVSKFVIIEAKNHFMKDFIIRQLFYPYKVWKKNTTKEIVPIMLIKHDNIYNFFIYSFENDNEYNSIKLQNIKRYILDEIYTPIEIIDIINIMNNLDFVEENPDVPFPQADTFEIVLDLLEKLNEHDMSNDEVKEFIQYVPRQKDYYTNAVKYLGFAKQINNNYSLTEYGKNVMNMKHKERTLEIIRAILSHKPFYIAMQQQLEKNEFDKKEIARIIDECRSELNRSTPERRTGSVVAWIKWILDITLYME